MKDTVLLLLALVIGAAATVMCGCLAWWMYFEETLPGSYENRTWSFVFMVLFAWFVWVMITSIEKVYKGRS